MNYFSLHMIQDIHMSWTKKINTLLLQIFGQEAAFDNKILSKTNVHCDVFNITFPRVSNENPWPILASRKLYNPFKWLEFGLALLVETPGWAIKRSYSFLLKHIQLGLNQKRIKKIKDLVLALDYQSENWQITFNQINPLLSQLAHVSKKDYDQLIHSLNPHFARENFSKESIIKILEAFAKRYKKTGLIPLPLKFLAVVLVVLSNIIASFILDLPFAIIRRILAPSRYIIRPFFQYKHSDPFKWKALCTATILFTLFIALSIASGGIGLTVLPIMLGIAHLFSGIAVALGASSTASIVCLGVGFVTTAHIIALACLQKTFLGLTDLFYATKRILGEFIYPYLPKILKEWKESPNPEKTIEATPTSESPTTMESPAENVSEINVEPSTEPTSNGTTTFIAQYLHGINPEIIDLKLPENQSDFYNFALFTGTESLFYPKTNMGTLHPYGQFVFEEEAKSPLLAM